MTVEYLIDADERVVTVNYSFGRGNSHTLRLKRADISATINTDMYDAGMRLVPATEFVLSNGRSFHVPVPYAEIGYF